MDNNFNYIMTTGEEYISPTEEQYESTVDMLEAILPYDKIRTNRSNIKEWTMFDVNDSVIFDNVTYKSYMVCVTLEHKKDIVFIEFLFKNNVLSFGRDGSDNWHYGAITSRPISYHDVDDKLAHILVQIARCLDQSNVLTVDDIQRPPILDETTDYMLVTDEGGLESPEEEEYNSIIDRICSYISYDSVKVEDSRSRRFTTFMINHPTTVNRARHLIKEVIVIYDKNEKRVYVNVHTDRTVFQYNVDTDEWIMSVNNRVPVSSLKLRYDFAKMLFMLANAVNPGTLVTMKSLLKEELDYSIYGQRRQRRN